MTEQRFDDRVMTVVSSKDVCVNQNGWHNQISLLAGVPRTLMATKAYACLQAHACVTEVRAEPVSAPKETTSKTAAPKADKPAVVSVAD